jgi:hypothetical protein
VLLVGSCGSTRASGSGSSFFDSYGLEDHSPEVLPWFLWINKSLVSFSLSLWIGSCGSTRASSSSSSSFVYTSRMVASPSPRVPLVGSCGSTRAFVSIPSSTSKLFPSAGSCVSVRGLFPFLHQLPRSPISVGSFGSTGFCCFC